MSRTKKKLREWVRRYGPAEISGTITAVVCAFIAFRITDNEIITAYVGSVSESIGYYGVMIRQEHKKDISGHPWQTARNLFLEFGPSEVLDSFATRPLFMGLGIHFWGQGYGLIAGKLAADFVFYVPTIIIYEFLNKKKDGLS